VYQTGLVTSNFTSSDYFLPNNFSTDMELNLTLPSVGIYGGWYNGTLKYYNSNFNTTLPIIFNVSAPEMWIETNISSPMRLMPNGTIIFKTNFWRYSQSFKIYVNNTGVKDLTTVLINLTGNLTNGTNTMPIWNLTMTPSNGSGVSVEDYGNMQLGSVPASDDSYITLSINTSECGSGAECGEGDYDTVLLISSDNGQPFTDANLTLRINVTHNLDITANSITAYTYANSSSLTAPVITRAGVNITINFTAKYADGSYMANLDATNMTIFDDYTGDWKGYSYGNVSSFDSASSAFGVYAMNISTPAMSSGRAEFDIHNLKIQVNDGYSNVGNGTTSYNLSAPEPYATFSVSDNQLNLSSVENATLTVRFGNNGTETLYNMSVLLGINATSGLTMSKVVCNMTESNLTLNITAGELNTTLCIITLTPTAVGDYNVSTSSIGAKDQYGVDYNGTQEYYVVGVFSGTGSSSGDDEGTGGDDDVVLVADLLITTSPSAMEIMQGESNSTTVMANNTGTKAAKVKLEIELAGIQTDIVPTETTISSGKGKTFTVDITIPDDFEIGEHSTNFKAYVSTDSNIYDTKSFILTVTPTEATKQEINALHAEYTNNYNEIYSEFYNLVNEGKVSNDNKTMVESLLTQVKSDLDAAATAIAADDYLAANSLLNSVNVNIDRIRNYMDDFEAGGQGGSGAFAPLWMWIVIGLIVAGGVGFLIYMLMPPEGYSIKYGYKPPKKENFIIKLRTLKSKLTNIFPGKKAILITSKKKDDKTKKKKEVRYVAGYEKALPTDYKFSPPSGFKSSLISKMSKIRSSSKIGPYEFISQKKKKRDDE
ncbi:MAG: hypothetical protein KKG13_01105, partial [Nanoarchaeota archaeon]|nr:hypothetical protein [Nanoarchaeota archaeon]